MAGNAGGKVMECNMDRRGVLKALAGGGALLATSRLPSFAKDDPFVFPQRGRFERLSLGYVRIDAGAAKPFSALHISDTHLTTAYPGENMNKQRLALLRTRTFGGRQEEALRDSLAWAKENADLVIHTGDLIDWQSEANFDQARAAYKEFSGASAGNHEYSPEMWLSEQECTCDESYKALTGDALRKAFGNRDVSFSATEFNGVNFIAMDDVYGTVTESQVERFRSEAKKGMPIVLCMHVPFFSDHIWMANAVFWKRIGGKFASAAVPKAASDYARQLADRTTRDFIAYLKSEPSLRGILAGHLHFDVCDRFSQTAMHYVVAGNFMFRGQHVLFT